MGKIVEFKSDNVVSEERREDYNKLMNLLWKELSGILIEVCKYMSKHNDSSLIPTMAYNHLIMLLSSQHAVGTYGQGTSDLDRIFEYCREHDNITYKYKKERDEFLAYWREYTDEKLDRG